MNEQFLVIQDLMNWVRTNIGKSVNFSIDHWAFNSNNSTTIEYKLWIDGIINKTTQSLEDLINLIPSIKQFCILKKEFLA